MTPTSFPTMPSGSFGRRALLRAGGLGAAATTLAGCARGSATNSMDFWQWYAPQSGGGYAVSRQNDWFVDLVDTWNRQSGSSLSLTYIPVSQYTEGTQLQVAFAADQGPDLFIVSPGDFLRFHGGDVLYDFTDDLGDLVDDFYASALATRTVDGRVYALPMENEPQAMFYGVDAFEEAGLSEGDIPQTWDQMLDVAEKLRTPTRYGLLLETDPTVYQAFTWYPYLWQVGEEVTNGSTSAFASEAVIQALTLWDDAIRADIAPRTTQGGGGGDLVSNLAAGYAGMQQMTIPGSSSLDEGAPDFRYGMFPLPAPTAGSDPLTAMGGWAICVNRHSPRAQEAAKFAIWAVASTESRDRMVQWSFDAKKTLPARRSVMESAVTQGLVAEDPVMRFAAYDVLGLPADDPGAPDTPFGRGEPRYPPEVVKAVIDALQNTIFKDTPVEEVAQRADDQINSALTGYDGAEMGS